jgi:8-amino-7-oxononanoate synthase
LDGREVILFSSNDYLGLCAHPKIIQSAADCAQRYGWGAGAARLMAGSMTPHLELERAIAGFLGKEAALLFGSGYAANTGVLTALMGRGDHVFADRLVHASIIDGARHSGARLARFPHNDPAALEVLLKKAPAKGRRLVVTEGVFSMEGDIPPLKEIARIAKDHGALLMVDDAHGFGVFGPDGRGTVHEAGIEDMVDIHVITLGKALGGYGGVVAAPAGMIDGFVNFSRPFIYSTALPPAVAAGGLAALEIVKSAEGEARRKRLHENGARVAELLRAGGYQGDWRTQIIPVIIGESRDAANLSTQLLEKGIFAPAIRPPTVPKGSARLRLSVTSEHTEGDLGHLAAALSLWPPLPFLAPKGYK